MFLIDSSSNLGQDTALVMLEGRAEYVDRDGDEIVIDQRAIDSMQSAFRTLEMQARFAGVPVGFGQMVDGPAGETAAGGHLMATRQQPSGLFGVIRFTAAGQAVVPGGNYRFISVEYAPDDCEVVSQGPPRRLRPFRLGRLSFTNHPRNVATWPITNRASDATGAAQPGLGPLGPADAFQLKVILNRQLHGLNFQRAWDFTARQHPALCRAASESHAPRSVFYELPLQAPQDFASIVNRASSSGFDVQNAWQRLRRQPRESLGELQAAVLGGLVVNRDPAASALPAQASAAFEQRLLALLDSGLDGDTAWAQMRENGPLTWARYVLNVD